MGKLLTLQTVLRPMAMGCALLAGFATADAATSVTRHGITWTFSSDRPTGTYANGDPWVVGPVTITKITPTPTAGRNGTMINPKLGRDQGFDNRISSYHPYSESLNVGNDLPLTVPVDSSVVSSISAATDVNMCQIENFAILTVVASAPKPGSFRPPYIGDGSRASQWNVSDLDYSKLNRVPRAPLSAMPSVASVAANFEKVWYEQDLTWTGRYMHPGNIVSNGYGKDMAIVTGNAGLILNTDLPNSEKETLLIRYVQYGIDIYGILKKGGNWYDTGGHNPGRLAPILVAAMVLNDSGMKAYISAPDQKSKKFSEQRQTWYVTAADVGRELYTGDGRPREKYIASDVGMAEWGETHTDNPSRDGRNWDAYYRDICGGQMTAVRMITTLMGAESVVNWPALLDYADRHVNYEQSSGYKGEFKSNPTPSFHKQMYNLYKNAPPPSGDSPAPAPSVPAAPSNLELTSS